MIKYVVGIIVVIAFFYYVISEEKKEQDIKRFLLFWVVVPPGYQYIRLRFGNIYRRSCMKEGYNLVMPGIHTVFKKVNMKVQDIELNPEDFWLKDQVEGTLKWFIRFRVMDAIKYVREYDNPIESIKNSAFKKAKNALGRVTIDDTTNSLDSINVEFEKALNELNLLAKNFGVEILAINATKIDFKTALEEALERKKRAEFEAAETIKHAQAYAEAKMSKFEIYIRLAEEMNKRGVPDVLFEKILQAANVSDAVETQSVDTLILPSGSASVVGSVASMMKTMNVVKDNE